MTQETRVATRDDRQVALYDLETSFAMAVRQRELLETYIRDRLKPDRHFYTVGEGQKPSLTKEGAELICLPHVLKGHYTWLSGPENPPMDDSPYQITINCGLERNGNFAGEGVGSASSMVTKKDGTRVQRQRDPGLRHNATIKMACKSAYIAATLNSTAASEFFTQDLEDDQTGETKKPEQKGHWCSEHKTPFFMKGKMKSYAHPIEGTDPVVWCHEEKPKTPQEATESPPQPEPEQTKGDVSEETESSPFGEAEQTIEPYSVDELVEVIKLCNWQPIDVQAYAKEKGWTAKTYGELEPDQLKELIDAIKQKPK